MISREELGRRIRECRVRKGMTLKRLDEASGFSATHISEIERGRTSPTIGALLRIAAALGKPPSYFIEEDALSEVAFTPRDRREKVAIEGVTGEYLTPGIPGGRLQACLVRLEPGGPAIELPARDGEECGYVLRGELDFSVGRDSWRLLAGYAIHHSTDLPRVLRSTGGEGAEVVLIATHRLGSLDNGGGAVEPTEPADSVT